MILNREPIRRWFGFTRRERSSSMLLLLIIIFLFVFRYIVPKKSRDIEEIFSGFYDTKNLRSSDSLELLSGIQLFSFDPNTASFDSLIMLGLASKEARTLINYRNNGGKFSKPEDIKKIYGMDEKKADELIPLIILRSDTAVRSVKLSGYQQESLIDINNCDSATLVTLPGIGPVLSARIIKFRRLLGGFARIEQLQEVYGLPEDTYRRIHSAFYVDTLALSRININSAAYNEIARLPYFEKYEVTAILKYRELNGNIANLAELTGNKIISLEKANKVKPYLEFR